MNTSKKVIIVGTGLGGLTLAVRLAKQGYSITMIEKFSQAGGRLNELRKDGFTWDMAPTFFSMSYEFKEFVKDCEIEMPFAFHELDPLYAVDFRESKNQYTIFKNLQRLAQEFANVEPDFEKKMKAYLHDAGIVFHDTIDLVVKKNFNTKIEYLRSLSQVPWGHAPKMYFSMWDELNKHFQSDEVKSIFSLVAFFLGDTPFKTPAVYSLLSYTEMVHDGYHNVKGGMYQIVRGLIKELNKHKVAFIYNTEICGYENKNNRVHALIDSNGNKHEADIFVANADAAVFRGKVMKRTAFSEDKLDKMKWTMAPLTLYLGVKGKVENLHHHHYFLGNDFKSYASGVLNNSVSLQKPYYYVNRPSMLSPDCAPEGCDSLFVLCPVPHLLYKKDWMDRDEMANNIIRDMSDRTGFDIESKLVSKTILDPTDWERTFNLHRGSGLGLAHNLLQIGALRPANKDEIYSNLFYVGASTVPGTGLPMVVISSKLCAERVNEYNKKLCS